ncbi:MAG: hypothetical protein M1816_006869 [Peltula sp. TS41687]|nr:MAG: hypothetical protein M1816_006869 [Peltula sp. TS41687]
MHLITFPTLLLLLQSVQARWPDLRVESVNVVQAPIRTKGQPCEPGYPEKDPLDVRSELIKHGVMPAVVDDFYPSISFEVNYPSGARAHYGNWVDIDAVKEKPTVTLHPVGPILDPRVHYYLAMTDPDAPTRLDPKDAEFCHWLVNNITQTCHCGGDPSVPSVSPGIDIVGDDLVPYYKPSPTPDTAPHRYVFVLLRPKDLAANPVLPKPEKREHWGAKKHAGVKEYAQANNLEVVGANLFYVENRKGAPSRGGDDSCGRPSEL